MPCPGCSRCAAVTFLLCPRYAGGRWSGFGRQDTAAWLNHHWQNHFDCWHWCCARHEFSANSLASTDAAGCRLMRAPWRYVGRRSTHRWTWWPRYRWLSHFTAADWTQHLFQTTWSGLRISLPRFRVPFGVCSPRLLTVFARKPAAAEYRSK